jgi:hypothetical protein
MPTVGERLATLEAEVREIRQDARAVLDLLNGGNGVAYERSVRGRLHHIESALGALVLRRKFGLGMAKGWQGGILILCAVATAAAAWWAALGL